MTPYEQAKVESEYFKLLKKDNRVQREQEQKAGDLSDCLNLEQARISRRPMGGNWHGYNLDIIASKLIVHGEARQFVVKREAS